jgi:replicative DNA helicase
MAQKLKVGVVLLSQLNRSGNKSERPTMHDLKESGDIEGAADQVVLIHHKEIDMSGFGYCDIILDKNRTGPVWLVKQVKWTPKYFRFQGPSDY